jgi:hypothetical protein
VYRLPLSPSPACKSSMYARNGASHICRLASFIE